MWDRTSNETGWSALLGEARGTADVSPYAAPARADDLSDLPPAFIDVGSAETFRDEDIAYASRIWQVGGIAELMCGPAASTGSTGSYPRPHSRRTTARHGRGAAPAAGRGTAAAAVPRYPRRGRHRASRHLDRPLPASSGVAGVRGNDFVS